MKKELPSSIKDTFKNNPYVLGFSNNKVILDLDFLQNLYDLCGGDFGNRSFIKSYLKTKGFDVSAKGFTLAKNLSRRFIFKGRPTKPLAVAFCSRSTLLEYSDQTSAPTKTDLTVESDSCDEATIKTEPFSPEEAADCKTVENANSEEITSPKELLGGSVEEAETCDDVANEEAEVMPFEEKLFSEMEGQAKEALGERQSSVLAWESIPVSGSGESQESIPVSGSGESRESIPVSGSGESQESIPGSGKHQDSSAEAFKSRRNGKAKPPINDQGSPVKVLSESELVDTGNFYFHAKGIALRPDLEKKLAELYPSLPIEKALEAVGIPPASLGKERIAKILRRIRFIRKRSNDAQNADGTDGENDKVRNISTLSDEELLATNLWDGPMSLHDMFDLPDERAKAFIPDYRINLVYPKDMEEADFDRMGDNDLGFLMKVLKLGNKNFGTMFSEERYKTVNPESAILANEIANLGLKIEVTEKGDVDMCQAMERMRVDSEISGLVKGLRIAGWTDEAIREKIKTVYELTDEEAELYVPKPVPA